MSDPLDSLLAVAEQEFLKIDSVETGSELQEVDIFAKEDESVNIADTLSNSLIHDGNTDSSDDEENRNFEEQKYSKGGKEVKKLLSDNNPDTPLISTSYYGQPKKRVSTWKTKAPIAPIAKKPIVTTDSKPQDVLIDPFFGIRIVNPLISSAMLREKMEGRAAVTFAQIGKFIMSDFKQKDWVISGVIVSKSPVKTSQKGSQYSIWTLSDLKDEIKTVALFMFSSAHKNLWKVAVGTVIGVLNPNVLERKENSKDEATLSVDNAHKVMVFGQSKDFGLCKSAKKNGDKCNAIVNLSHCEFCIYHIKQEYQKCSRRSELQANFSGKGLLALRNKVLGKNEVFYAGKSYTAIPARKSKKLEQHDYNILQNLSGNSSIIRPKKSKQKKAGSAMHLDVSPAQRQKDIEILKKLGGTVGLEAKTNFTGTHSSNVTLESSKATALDVINKLKAQKTSDPHTNKLNGNSTNLDVLPAQRQKDIENLDDSVGLDAKNNFTGHSTKVTLESSKTTALDVINKLKAQKTCDPQINKQNNSMANCNTTAIIKNNQKSTESNLKSSFNEERFSAKNVFSNTKLGVPKLSGFGGSIDLSVPVVPRRVEKAKLNALDYIQKNGPIKKIDPNSTKGSGKKRPLDGTGQDEDKICPKKSKLQESEFISDRFKKMMAETSKHMDLVEEHDNQETEKYFRKLEVKEKMEEKMVNTHKMACKAVRCLKCKYTSFSASDLCKAEKHPLKVFDSMKRFYKCGNCQNRTVTLDVIPTKPCNNCGSTKWEKTGMMKEKIALVQHSLSIRGGEQKFINSVAADANLDLLVPDDGC